VTGANAQVRTEGRTARYLGDFWFRLRNRILSDPNFQRWAARFPLTRFIARRRAAGLFDLCAGFVYSQVLYAAVTLGLFEALSAGAMTATELAPRLSLPLEATRRLLDAAASLRLVERRRQGRYDLGIHGAALLGNPAALAMIEHHALLYRDLADPVALLRRRQTRTELGKFWSYATPPTATATAAEVAGYSRLMSRSLSLIADDILEAYPMSRHRCLLDVGGGEGAFLEAAGARAPTLALILFDLPPVAHRARERLENLDIARRTTVIGGDVLVDPLPVGADLVSLVRVIHDHEDPQALEILRASHRALPPGGVLLLAEPMARTSGAEPMGDAYFGFYLLAMGQGRPRTATQLRALLLEAGFDRVRNVKTRRPILCGLLVAERV
jgi:demethylspheroidene O-methyltransferase